MSDSTKKLISEWIKKHSKVYGETISGISPSLQEEAVPEIFLSLASSGVSADDVVSWLGAITSPLAPKSSSNLKKLRKYSKLNDASAKEVLNSWCFAASMRVASSFNDVFFSGDPVLHINQVYELMCKARGLTPKTISKTRELTEKEIDSHLSESSNITLGKKEASLKEVDYNKTDTAIDKYPRITMSDIQISKNRNEFPELEDISDEALEFFGLKNVDKNKL